MVSMWLKKFKLAVIAKDAKKIGECVKEMPQFDNLKEMEEAYHLFLQAKALLESQRDETLASMNKIKVNINFLKSSTNEKKSTSGIKFNV